MKPCLGHRKAAAAQHNGHWHTLAPCCTTSTCVAGWQKAGSRPCACSLLFALHCLMWVRQELACSHVHQTSCVILKHSLSLVQFSSSSQGDRCWTSLVDGPVRLGSRGISGCPPAATPPSPARQHSAMHRLDGVQHARCSHAKHAYDVPLATCPALLRSPWTPPPLRMAHWAPCWAGPRMKTPWQPSPPCPSTTRLPTRSTTRTCTSSRGLFLPQCKQRVSWDLQHEVRHRARRWC